MWKNKTYSALSVPLPSLRTAMDLQRLLLLVAVTGAETVYKEAGSFPVSTVSRNNSSRCFEQIAALPKIALANSLKQQNTLLRAHGPFITIKCQIQLAMEEQWGSFYDKGRIFLFLSLEAMKEQRMCRYLHIDCFLNVSPIVISSVVTSVISCPNFNPPPP